MHLLRKFATITKNLSTFGTAHYERKFNSSSRPAWRRVSDEGINPFSVPGRLLCCLACPRIKFNLSLFCSINNKSKVATQLYFFYVTCSPKIQFQSFNSANRLGAECSSYMRTKLAACLEIWKSLGIFKFRPEELSLSQLLLLLKPQSITDSVIKSSWGELPDNYLPINGHFTIHYGGFAVNPFRPAHHKRVDLAVH